jgi:hypothetical protein
MLLQHNFKNRPKITFETVSFQPIIRLSFATNLAKPNKAPVTIIFPTPFVSNTPNKPPLYFQQNNLRAT